MANPKQAPRHRTSPRIDDDASAPVPENKDAKGKGVKPVNRFDLYADAHK
jgi:hypothetical protein